MRAAWLALRRERGNVTSFSPLRYLTFRRMVRDTHTHMHVYFISGTSTFHALAQFFHWISKFVRDSMTVRHWSSLKAYIQGHSLSFVRSKNRGWEKLNERDGDEQHFWRGTFVYGLRLYIKKKKKEKPVGERERRRDRRSRGSLGPGTPGAKQQAVRKMDGLLTVPHMELSQVISPFTSPSRGAQRALIDCVLNYVFTCVSPINERNVARAFLKSATR